jgi:hypothetical protein
MENETETKNETPVEKIDVLEIVGRMMAMWPAGGEAPTAERLLEDLPPEAIMGPKRDRDGNVLKTADANMTGYKPAYVIRAAVERLGACGWVEYCTMGPETDVYLSKSAAEAKRPDGIGISCHMVIWFPGLNTFRVSLGSGATAVRGDYERAISDATKAAQTNARKRAMALIGIGWKGYTDDMSPDDHGDEPPVLPGRPQEPKKYTPPAPPVKPAQAAAKPAPAPAPEPVRTFADAANAVAGPDYDQAFGDVFELLASDGVISRSEKGQKWFRDRAAEWGFFGSDASGGAKVQLKERAEALHLEKLGQLHAAYKEIWGADEAARRDWLEKMTGKRSTADCTLNERIYALAKIADLRREKSGF